MAFAFDEVNIKPCKAKRHMHTERGLGCASTKQRGFKGEEERPEIVIASRRYLIASEKATVAHPNHTAWPNTLPG